MVFRVSVILSKSKVFFDYRQGYDLLLLLKTNVFQLKQLCLQKLFRCLFSNDCIGFAFFQLLLLFFIPLSTCALKKKTKHENPSNPQKPKPPLPLDIMRSLNYHGEQTLDLT